MQFTKRLHRRRASVAVVAAIASLSLTCSDDTSPPSDVTIVRGRAVLGGPIVDAEVVVYQLATATGERTNERGRTRTDDLGRFTIDLGGTLNTVEIDVIGGTYRDEVSGTTVARGPAVLHGLAFDLALAEERTEVNVTPWSHLVYAVGERRAAVEPDGRLASLKRARDLLAVHLGFDPTHTAIADLGTRASSATPEFLHAVTLAGLATRAQIANADGFADVTAESFTAALDTDARGGDPEHAFDGNGDQLSVTATCPAPPGCDARGPRCYASCTVSPHLLRAHLADAVRAYLRTHTATGQTAATLASWLERVRTADEPILFPPGEPEPFDTLGPRIQWAAPAADGATVVGDVPIDVRADDPGGVATLIVVAERADGELLRAVADTDPSTERFVGALDTRGLDEGVVTLRATATDLDGNDTHDPPRMIDVNNLPFGTLTATVAVSGRLSGAPVRIYRFDTGTRGALLGEWTTSADGTAANIQIADGYNGPILVEAGSAGTYREDAAPPGTPPVTLDLGDQLRTVVGDYRDGNAVTAVVSPLTTFAVAYLGYLQDSQLEGADVASRWIRALGAMERHFGVANLRTLAPLPPEQMLALGAGARHGLDLIGLSQLALGASTQGGGTGGTFGTTMHAMRITRVLSDDIRDGCWDGRAGTTPLLFGGIEAPDDLTSRRTLANAIVAYLVDGARNQTPTFDGAGDVLPLLDTLSAGGGNTAIGSCRMTPGDPDTIDGFVFDDAGGAYDRIGPTITFVGDSPGAGFVRGTIRIDAVAVDLPDLLDPIPTLAFTSPPDAVDIDGDETDSDAHAIFDTAARPDGNFEVALESFDDAINRGTATRMFTIDNTPPTITITGVAEGAWYTSAPIVTFSVDELNLETTTATLDGLPFSSGGQVSAMGRHTLVVTARDRAGTEVTRMVTFHVDSIAPTLALGPVTPGGPVVRGMLTATAIADDNLRAIGALGTDITIAATGPNGTVAPISTNPSTLADGRRQVVPVFDTNMIADGVLSIRFDVSDRAGNPASAVELVRTIDNTAPVPTVSGVTSGAWYGGPVTISIGQTDTNPGTTTALLDGVAFGGGVVSDEGGHTLVVTAIDAAGGTGTRTVTFTIDRTPPTLALATPPPPAWVRGMLTLEVIAGDTLAAAGSLTTPIGLVATGASGVFSPMISESAIVGGQRRMTVMFPTTVAGDGPLSLAFSVSDRAGHPAVPLIVNTAVDNTPPTVALDRIRNQSGPVVLDWISELAATVTGTVSTGGSPVTVTVTTTPGGATSVTPTTGTFTITTSSLPQGAIVVTATAIDAAGNPAAMIATTPLTVDRTGPTITFAPTSALDERGCDVAIDPTIATALGANPVAYTCTGAPARSLHTATAATEVGKFTNRLTAVAADNPLVWNPTADDGAGVGLDASPATIQSQVFLTSTFPLGDWGDSSAPTLANGNVSATIYATAARAPQLATHTAPFSIMVRARDRLGNETEAPPILTWTNRPLAPPVLVRYVGLTSPNDPQLGAFSLFRHSLTNPIGLAGAMSSGGFYNDAARGLYEFELWNPHAQPINVGFFVPAFSGATYTRQVWEVNPFINGNAGIVNNPPAGTCGWNAGSTSFRMSGGAAPFTCGSGTSCSCFAPGGEPVDSKPAATTAPLTTSQLIVAAWNRNGVRLAPLTITPAISGYPFYEFTTEPAYASTTNGPIDRAGHTRVFVALPNLDLWSPVLDTTADTVQESDGLGSETHVFEQASTRFSPIMTTSFYERWADCRAVGAGGVCTALHARRRLRATVRADVTIPAEAVKPFVRTRAAGSSTASVEKIPDTLADDTRVVATHAAAWGSCETGASFSCPTIPDFAFSQPF